MCHDDWQKGESNSQIGATVSFVQWEGLLFNGKGMLSGFCQPEGEYPHRARTAHAPRAHRVRYLNNFSRRWSTGRGVVDGTCWALRRYHSP